MTCAPRASRTAVVPSKDPRQSCGQESIAMRPILLFGMAMRAGGARDAPAVADTSKTDVVKADAAKENTSPFDASNYVATFIGSAISVRKGSEKTRSKSGAQKSTTSSLSGALIEGIVTAANARRTYKHVKSRWLTELHSDVRRSQAASSSAALRPGILLPQALLREASPFLAGMHASVGIQMPLVRILIRQLPQQCHYQTSQALHNSSARSLDSTNGASHTRDSRVPWRIPIQMRNESTRIVATSSMRTPQITASRRALKIRV